MRDEDYTDDPAIVEDKNDEAQAMAVLMVVRDAVERQRTRLATQEQVLSRAIDECASAREDLVRTVALLEDAARLVARVRDAA